MTAGEELAWTSGVCGIVVVAAAFLAEGAQALEVVMILGLPLAIFVGVAYAAGPQLAPGWLCGTTLAFLAVTFFEAYWETHLYTGPNSMPGFVFLFMCFPLSLVALWPARVIVGWLPDEMLVARLLLSFVTVFLIGAVVILANLYVTK